ncbi:MAG: energy transducer TonB [Spirochaetia bacterium]|nr:energy transducer TonB [Spirochaetia bacterium]
MFASDYHKKGVAGSFATSLILHIVVFLMIFSLINKNKRDIEDYTLTEITMLEEVPEEKKMPVPEMEKPKKMFDILKQVIPIKQNQQIQLAKPQALDLKKPEMNINKPSALSLDKSKMDTLKPAKALDLDNEIGQKKLSPAMIEQQKIALAQQNKLQTTTSKININTSTQKSGFLPSSRPVISAAAAARSGSGLKTAAIAVPTPTPAVKAASADNIVIPKEKGTALLISGQISGRTITRKLAPQYPRWAEEQGIEAQVTISFSVRPDGSVKDNAYVDRTSGYPELDQLALEALQQFRWVSISSSDDQSGMATFVYKLAR